MDLTEKITERAKEFFADSKGSHDWDHTLRVYNTCMHIGRKENADMEILKIAAILHDIGREHQDKHNGKYCHAEQGAILAKKLLSEFQMDENKISRIIHCIETHRFRGSLIPESREAKILFDADKLDSIGAVGIGRAFLFAGEIGAKLHDKNVDIETTESYSRDDTCYREYLVKLRYVKERMQTNEGRRIAEERHNFMVEFFNRLNREIEGNL
ncbi:MAG: HD domain-containing protein [Spirochaetes bacterium]|nr:HD domain-containing protein [Spirochaetota bacterium]